MVFARLEGGLPVVYSFYSINDTLFLCSQSLSDGIQNRVW